MRSVMRLCMCSPLLGKAIFLPWIRAALWDPAPPTLSRWTTALAWWTRRLLPTAWHPTWWTALQVMVSNLPAVTFLHTPLTCLTLSILGWWQRNILLHLIHPCWVVWSDLKLGEGTHIFCTVTDTFLIKSFCTARRWVQCFVQFQQHSDSAWCRCWLASICVFVCVCVQERERE